MLGRTYIAKAQNWLKSQLKRVVSQVQMRNGAASPKIELFPVTSTSETISEWNAVSTANTDTLVYAVGDIHGRADLLERLIDLIKRDAVDHVGTPHLVFLGDYVDRGFQSRQVLDRLMENDLSAFDLHFLKGNHEAALLRFLRDFRFGPNWAEFGGLETLVSYGVRPPRIRTGLDEWEAARNAFEKALPASHLDFINSLRLMTTIGEYVFVHAGLRPGVPLEAQEEADLLWIREPFLQSKTPFDQVVVHGHTPAQRPHIDERRIGIDTGAYLTGRLTAARLEKSDVTFIMTQ